MVFYLLVFWRKAVLAVLAVWLLWEIFRSVSVSQIRIRDIAAYRYSLFQGKRRVNALAAALFVLGIFFAPGMNALSNAALLALNYSGASQGLAPNGTRFNQAGILSDEVLERAIEKGALEGVRVKDLKKTLRVEPLVEGDSQLEEEYHISTQFTLYYNAIPETAHLNGDLVTQLVLQAYKERFVEQYSDNVSSLSLDMADQKDYLDLCKYFSKALEEIAGYMMAMRDKNVSFRSETTGDSFWGVASNAYSVRDVMVKNLEAYILETGLSWDKGTYLGGLSFENVNLDFDAQKRQMANRNYLAAIAMYENDMARTVLVPTYDKNSQFYMSRTRIGVDDFASVAERFAGEVTAIRESIAYNRYVARMMLLNTPDETAGEKAEQVIGEIRAELHSLTDRAKTLVREYSASQANNYMTITNNTGGTLKVLVYNTGFMLLAAVMLHLGVYMREVRKAMGGKQ